MNFDVYSFTNHGGRSYNEDHVGHKVIGDNGIFVVADGLGGHRFGEVASQCVVETLVNNFNGNFSGNAGNYLTSAISVANDAVVAVQKEKNETLKSTVVALAIEQGAATWMNVGDSRLYYFHRGALRAYTNDHSVAYKKYKGGEITREQLCHDEDQSALLRSVGNPDGITPELYGNGIQLEDGDAFFLCSDGAWEYLFDEEILIDLMKATSAKDWGEKLLLRIIDRVDGSHDNLSVMTVLVGETDFWSLPRPEMNGVSSTDDAHSLYAIGMQNMEQLDDVPPVTPVPQTLPVEQVQQTVSKGQVTPKNDKKLITIVLSIVAILLIAFVVVLIIFLSKKKEQTNIEDQDAQNIDESVETPEENIDIDIEIEPEDPENTTPDGQGGLQFPPETQPETLVPEKDEVDTDNSEENSLEENSDDNNSEEEIETEENKDSEGKFENEDNKEPEIEKDPEALPPSFQDK